MYDKYDSPHGNEDEIYDDSPMDKAKDAAGPAIDAIKQNKMAIIIGIIILLAGFFAYDYFIGSVKNVSFEIRGTEGDAISAATTILGSDGKTLETVQPGQTIGLRAGMYNIEIRKAGFKRYTSQISVLESGPVTATLEIAKDLELSGQFPQTFFAGETKQLTLTMTNNESGPEEAGLVLDGDAEDAMELDYEKPLILFPGTNEITATLSVKSDVGSKQIGENKSGEIRIQGLDNKNAKITGKYSLIKADVSDIKVKVGSSTTSADFGDIRAGESEEKAISVENKTDSTITGIKIEVEITSSDLATKEEVLEWFSFTPSNEIDEIAPDEKKEISIRATPPIGTAFPSGKTVGLIDGVIKVSSSFFTKTFKLTLEVEKPETELSASGLRESYSIRKSSGSYPETNDFIEIQNSGKTTLMDFELRVACVSPGTGWLTIENNQNRTTFETLAADQTKKVPFKISIPANVPEDTAASMSIKSIIPNIFKFNVHGVLMGKVP
ncbi:MAG: hypothetical protein NUV67_03560, partial [archaeon]|nr:hypothetical protein [archaeon]